MAYNVPVPVSSTPGLRPGEGEGRLINAYAEKDGETVYCRRSAGLAVTTGAMGRNTPRGLVDIGGVVFAAYSDGKVVAWNTTTTDIFTFAGSLHGFDGVTWARNNKVTDGVPAPDLVGVSETFGMYVVPVNGSGPVAAYPSPNLPLANSVSFLDGFFVFTIPDGRIFASELNSTEVNALSFTTAEAQPDGLLRGISTGGLFYAMGPSSIEPYRNVGASPFPLQRSTSIIPVGIRSTMAVAGYELGWDRDPFFVAHDGTVRRLSGYTAEPVSTPAVEAFISRSTPSTLRAFVYTAQAKAFWVITSDAGTWELNVNTGGWNERVSTGLVGWRGVQSVKSGNYWVMGDKVSNGLLVVDENATTEAGAAVTWTVETGPVKDFAARVAALSSYADFTEADGATVNVSWSHDGGKTWAVPLVRSLDQADRFPVSVNRHGLSTQHGMRLRYTSSATQDFSFMGVNATVQGRAP